jgi:DNA-directed RNA polymerase subunit RPC12/RpoP
MGAFFQRVVENPHDLGNAPKLVTANRDATRASRCLRCGAAIQVSLDLRVHEVRCAGCGHVEGVAAHVSDAERMQLDMQRQIDGNEAYKRLIAEGVPCGRCGGKNEVLGDGSVQVVCRFCAHTILLRDYVDEDAIARRKLRTEALAMRDGLRDKQKKSESRVALIVVSLVVVVIVVAIGLGLAFAR